MNLLVSQHVLSEYGLNLWTQLPYWHNIFKKTSIILKIIGIRERILATLANTYNSLMHVISLHC